MNPAQHYRSHLRACVRKLNRHVIGMTIWRRKLGCGVFFVLIFLGFFVFLRVHPGTLSSVPVKSGREFPVNIVEEHHEVLPYWFKAVADGNLPKHGNVLLHIDGHGDDAPPDFIPGYDVHRWPRTPSDVHKMMQSNDIFIVAAALVGMFKRVIWVWPKWDQKSHKKNWESYKVQFGQRITVVNDEIVDKMFCLCQFTGKGDKQCYGANKTLADTTNEKEKFRIEDHLCELHAPMVLWEEIREDLVEAKIRSGTWIKQNEHLMIDIDEDFFGCESGAKYLSEASVNWDDIERLDVSISELMCPTVTSHEAVSDSLFVKLTQEGAKRCNPQSKNCAHIKDDLLEFTKRKFETFKKRIKFICTKNAAELEEKLALFVERLLVLNQSQLKALVKTGFCMQTTPKSYYFETEQGSGLFQVCHGFNVPTNSVVLFHTPSEDEVKKRLQLLKSILGHADLPRPLMVTICRSIRDGYTPREHFKTIESEIILSLQNTYGHAAVVEYDRDLLGGRDGWPIKHLALLEK